MDYERKYKELAGKIKKAYSYAQTDSTKAVLKNLLPELKESKDEQIRKELFDFLTYGIWQSPVIDKVKQSQRYVVWLSWLGKQSNLMKALQTSNVRIGELSEENYYLKKQLEKQGEQSCNVSPIDNFTTEFENQGESKSDEMVEPKFKVGDWIVFNGLILHIDEIVKGYYRTTSIGDIPNSYDWDIDNLARLWTIQDAKDGDILVNGDEIVIFRNNSFNKKDLSGSMFVYCSLHDKIGYWYPIGGINPSNYVPATTEQRNTLFTKMHEAGYMWDAEKKELREISPKYPLTPDECINPFWDEKDEENFKGVIDALNFCNHEGVNPYDIDPLYLVSWLKSLRPQNIWKPSYEQMEALWCATEKYLESDDSKVVELRGKVLESLYDNLRQLREE